jgi:hypothetical protein
MVTAELWMRQIERWHDFYVIVGSSAAGLTGLMFVVVSLGPNVISTRGAPGVRAFVTPTVTYFATVLVIAALVTMPAISVRFLAAILIFGGAGGLIYMLRIGGHSQWRESELDWLDWVWYVALPIVSYLLVAAAGMLVWIRSNSGLQLVAGAVVLFLIIGIRNAWDLVLWMAQHARK